MNRILFTAFLLLSLSAMSCSGVKAAGEWEKVDPFELSLKPVDYLYHKWLALAVDDGVKTNAMTIAWGSIGMLWEKPVLIVYVHENRYTKPILDRSEYFTVTGFPDTDRANSALWFLGTKSGRRYDDKIAESGLTVERTELGNIRFAEGNLCIECRKIYQDAFKPELMGELGEKVYGDGPAHSFYIGEIVNVWKRETGLPEAGNRYELFDL